jgi:hypothetical protein
MTGVAGEHNQNLECVRAFTHIESRLDHFDAWEVRQNGSLEKLFATTADTHDAQLRMEGKIDQLMAGHNLPPAPSPPSKEDSGIKYLVLGYTLAAAGGAGAAKVLEFLLK